MNTYQRLRSTLLGAGPALCLLATLGGASWLYVDGGQRGRIIGFAQALPEAAAPIERARVASVRVSVGDEVVPGQILATLDTSVIDAEIGVAEAKMGQMEADLRVELSIFEQRLDVNVETLQRELSREREEQRRVTAEAAALGGEMSRIKQLVEDRQAVVNDLTKLDLQQATVTALVREKPRTLDLLAAQIKTAEQRRKDIKEGTSAAAAKLDADVRVARQNIELLEQRKAGYVLRATHGGRVAAIEKQPGEIAAAGDPVVSLVSMRERVVACVPERFGLGLREGEPARLWVHGQRGDALSGKTIALGPLVSELPKRCWVTPHLPMWGREVTIALDQPMEMIPGQTFDITFAPTGAAAPPAVAPPAPKAAADVASSPALMQVPPALLQRSRFEPSGLLARPGESRFLIVSDDTGKKGDEGEPWLFAMSATGAVEPAPIPVRGVAELDDVEAITGGDEGEIYLLSSQSYSKKGRRKPARTALLRLRPEGQGFRVDGEVHLAELLDAAPARAAALGLPDGTRALDIEGMTFRQGSLYVGLKAPLDAHGDAMIWRIAAPGALFGAPQPSTVNAVDRKGEGAAKAAKLLEDAGVSLWARARVDVELAGQPTPGGISDLTFLPDGSLAIASTPSTADGEAGAIWRVDRPAPGALSPRLLRRFPGLKPEGLAPSLSPGKLMIVFDAGSATPSFQELPWAQ